MKLPVTFVQLPLRFDAARLAAEIEALGAVAWRPHPEGYPGNDALPLIAVGGDPDNDAVAGAMRPTPNLARMPYLQQALASLQTVLGRTRLMRLAGGAEVAEHVDNNYYWHDRVRIHLPIVTQPSVRFACGEAEVHMAAGECWIFDTWRRHRVINQAAASRIHLVADSVCSAKFWELVQRGRNPERPTAAWQPSEVGFDPAARPALRCEAHNVPPIMTPWEMREHCHFICAEADPNADLRPLLAAISRLIMRWRANWAQHGDAESGLDEYLAAMEEFKAGLRELPALRMRNGLDLVRSLQNLVVVPAFGTGQPPPSERGEVPLAPLATARDAAR